MANYQQIKLRIPLTLALISVTTGVTGWLVLLNHQAQKPKLQSQTPTLTTSTIASSAVSSKSTSSVDKVRQTQIQKIEDYLARYRSGTSPMRGYAHILVDQAKKCGGDAYTLAAIAGAESAFGHSMYKKYNPFGYLNKKQYPNLKTALTELSCAISQRFISPCKNEINCIVRKYGVQPDQRDKHIRTMNWFLSQLKS